MSQKHDWTQHEMVTTLSHILEAMDEEGVTPELLDAFEHTWGVPYSLREKASATLLCYEARCRARLAEGI